MSNFLTGIKQYLSAGMDSPLLPDTQIIAALLFVLIHSAFIFLVYRVVSHRALYNKSLNIAIAALPFFICTIILCLQSNLVITLGTIGALAIIRFRTAVKDPVDMVYILWSIHLGIMAGCQLFMASILTSLCVAVVLLVMENLRLGRGAYTLVIHCDTGLEDELTALMKPFVRRMRLKSRNFTSSGVDYVFTLTVKNAKELCEKLSQMNGAQRFSLIEYDSEDIV
ncbi:MAG: DUF4956 domain-containing protein [Clostridia bacterium]|nr:DUF4956 domain-containing protein [Clostridia bacterium]